MLRRISLRACFADFGRRQDFERGVEHFADAVAVLGRYGEDLIEPPSLELQRVRFELRAVDFVCGDEHGLARRARKLRQLFVERRDACAGVHDQQDQRGLFERGARLPERCSRVLDSLVIRDDAARVDETELAPAPFRAPVDAVARYARLVADDRAPRAVSLLKRVDLPTFGRPSITTTGALVLSGLSGSSCGSMWSISLLLASSMYLAPASFYKRAA